MNCSICHKEIPAKGNWTHGNNAQPITNGRCCDPCDTFIVIPARMAPIMGAEKAVKVSIAMADHIHQQPQQERSPTNGVIRNIH